MVSIIFRSFSLSRSSCWTIGALVPDFEVSEHSDKDYLLVQVSFFTKQGRNQYSSLIIELAYLRARNEAAHEGSMIGD